MESSHLIILIPTPITFSSLSSLALLSPKPTGLPQRLVRDVTTKPLCCGIPLRNALPWVLVCVCVWFGWCPCSGPGQADAGTPLGTPVGASLCRTDAVLSLLSSIGQENWMCVKSEACIQETMKYCTLMIAFHSILKLVVDITLITICAHLLQ